MSLFQTRKNKFLLLKRPFLLIWERFIMLKSPHPNPPFMFLTPYVARTIDAQMSIVAMKWCDGSNCSLFSTCDLWCIFELITIASQRKNKPKSRGHIECSQCNYVSGGEISPHCKDSIFSIVFISIVNQLYWLHWMKSLQRIIMYPQMKQFWGRIW